MTAAALRTIATSRGDVAGAARDAAKALARMARPAGEFDASRYLGFYNVGTQQMRALARSIHEAHRNDWSIDAAMAFADALIVARHLEVKSVGIEVVACYRREFTPRLLPRWKGWLAGNYSANWATTDAICGLLIGPLLVAHPSLAVRMRTWARDRGNLWVRRASIVGLIPLARKGEALDVLYDVAAQLHPDTEDLIHKAVGWALREAGKADAPRLERHLRRNGPSIPRTTVRYAIERFDEPKRRALMEATRG